MPGDDELPRALLEQDDNVNRSWARMAWGDVQACRWRHRLCQISGTAAGDPTGPHHLAARTTGVLGPHDNGTYAVMREFHLSPCGTEGFFLVDTRAARVWVDARHVLVQTLVSQSDALMGPDEYYLRPNMPVAPPRRSTPADTPADSPHDAARAERFAAGVWA